MFLWNFTVIIAQIKQNWLKIKAIFVCRNVFQHFVKYFNLVKTQVKLTGFEPGKIVPCINSMCADRSPTATFQADYKFVHVWACMSFNQIVRPKW